MRIMDLLILCVHRPLKFKLRINGLRRCGVWAVTSSCVDRRPGSLDSSVPKIKKKTSVEIESEI